MGGDHGAEEITVCGLVQGVGFRPFVLRLALRLGLAGHVRNTGDQVVIRAAGPAEARDALVAALAAEAPPLARIDGLSRTPAQAPVQPGFHIAASTAGTVSAGIAPDVATCPACLSEMADPGARRHRYAFTNCTDCGPRFSIVAGLPYDRPATTMAGFVMCPACRAEYDNPADRRFHAQPIACPDCGPRLWLENSSGPRQGPQEDAETHFPRDPEEALPLSLREEAGVRGIVPSLAAPAPFGAASPLPHSRHYETEGETSDPIRAAAALLKAGGIIAVKGIGGFHIACDATHAEAVAELRRRKARPAKPLAVMADLALARTFADIGLAEAAALAHPSAPIVLVDLKPGALAPSIAPRQRHVGLMLPYAPLHHLLLEATGRPLVMTSGNRSGEPQAFRDDAARAALSGIVDGFVMHDRPIARRLDDSVVRLAAGARRVMRRGRGLAPTPLRLPEDFAGAPPVLAFGGELKSAICLASGTTALLSHHLGDLDEPDTGAAFAAALADYSALFAHAPAALAADLHPAYRASRLAAEHAEREGLPLIGVQHHHAHMAAAMAENGWRRADGRVAGIILDGLGHGADGHLRGAEILVGDYRQARHAAHLSTIPLIGGDTASREPWRVLLAHLDRAFGRAHVDTDAHLAALFPGRPVATLRAMADKGLNSPPAISAGRLFDAVAAFLGLAPHRLSFEGEAAMALEAAAAGEAEPYPFAIRAGAVIEIDPAPMWAALADDAASGRPPGEMALAFHRGLAAAFADVAADIAAHEDLSAVALSGGVFQNALLLEETAARLAAHGLRPLIPRDAPANDGGLAFGQAAVAAARLLS